MAPSLAEELASLSTATHACLRTRFTDAFGTAPPYRASRLLMELALAWHLQAQARGGFSPSTRRTLQRLVARHAKGQSLLPNDQPALLPGTRLVRDWQDERHQVTVQEHGFEYRGSRYSSLSEIARHITGTRWSGPAFFGLRKAARRETAA